jgi:2-dehydro-3-deoxyglucarate aldolase/4-hydroxy-2-oxoheptanedioate aldolase
MARPSPVSPYPEGGPGRQLKARLKAGDVLLGGILTEYARPSLVKLYRQAGFDFLYVEYEHVFFGPAALADTVLCARDNGLPVIAKTPQLERAEVAKLLECGVVGVQLPRTESRAEVETLRCYLKFPPQGTRAVAPGFGNSDYVQPADWQQWMTDQDAETLLVVHIETRAGFERSQEIISTPGVDMVYVGPGDFSIAMGRPGQYDHPDVVRPMEQILDLCRQHNVPFGTTASGPEAAGRWIDKGARFFETVDELALIHEGATRLVREYQRFIHNK